MCGICGIVTPKSLSPDQKNTLKQINHAMSHRGPDGEGFHEAEQVLLAMRRLSIIDLEGAWQPLYNEDRSLVLIGNGEIFNYIELRQMLSDKGHHLATDGDLEPILHLYEDIGLDFVHHLRGQFAIALYDTVGERLVVARDRIGEKPIYVYQTQTELVFASEIKALLQHAQIPFELDPIAIHDYLYFSSIPEPRTPLKHIRKLQAGHLLVVDIPNWTITESGYWEIGANGDSTATIEEIRSTLETVAEIVVRSDVPVGIALSGGLDSSAIAALTSKKYPHKMQAFSVGYQDVSPTDERRYAEALAQELGMPFHNIELSTDEMVDQFPSIVYWRDDLIADIAGYGYYSIAKCAREHGIVVLLMGQGGDELFWGYDWVRQATEDNLMVEQGIPWQKPLTWALADLPKNLSPRRWKRWLGQVVRGQTATQRRLKRIRTQNPERLIFWDSTEDWDIQSRWVEQLLSESVRQQVPPHHELSYFQKAPQADIPLEMIRAIMRLYLAQVGIAQGDRLGLASSVELRLPLVDYKLIESVLAYRQRFPDHELPHKAIFKQAIDGILPKETLNRPKRGFEPPVKRWYGALKTRYGHTLQHGHLAQAHILNPTVVEKLLAENTMTALDMTFRLLCLEMWCQEIRKPYGTQHIS